MRLEMSRKSGTSDHNTQVRQADGRRPDVDLPGGSF
jgi:hypothetical protein